MNTLAWAKEYVEIYDRIVSNLGMSRLEGKSAITLADKRLYDLAKAIIEDNKEDR